jgi:hypothetical protein
LGSRRRLVRASLLALVLCHGATPARQAGAPPDLSTEDGLRQALDALEARYEAAVALLGEARWSRWSDPSAADDTAEERAWDALAAVYADPLLQDVLTRWAYRTGVTRDPTLTRRVRLWHSTSQSAAWTIDPAIRRLARQLSRRLATQSYTLAGKPATREDLERTLRSDPDRTRRRAAWKEIVRGAGGMRADVVRLIRLRAVAARETRSSQIPRLIFEAEQLDQVWILQIVNVLGARTQAGYDRLLQQMRGALQVERLEPWDLDYGLEVLSAARWKQGTRVNPFDPAQAAGIGGRVLDRAGLAPAAPTAIRPLPTPFLFLPAKLPGAPRTLGSTSGGAVDRLAAAAPLLMAARAGDLPPMLKGYPWLPTARSTMADEGMAETMVAFLHDPLFVREALGLDAAQVESLQQDLRDRSLLAFRRALVDEAFEHAVCINPDADLDARYFDLFRKGTGTAPGPGDPVDWPSRLSFIEAPMTSLGRLFAPAIAAEAHARMAAALGDDRVRPGAAGAWLSEHCLAGGERLPAAERLASCTDHGHDTKLYFQWLGITAR